MSYIDCDVIEWCYNAHANVVFLCAISHSDDFGFAKKCAKYQHIAVHMFADGIDILPLGFVYYVIVGCY